MAKYYYKKRKTNIRKLLRLLGLLLVTVGILFSGAIFFPVIAESISSSKYIEISSPIPKATIVASSTVQSIISQGINSVTGFDSTNAKNWFPNAREGKPTASITSYTLSIPKLGIKEAKVSTSDYDLSKQLVNWGGTAVPGNEGNAVILGHSTIPWLFDPKDYKTIFATLHTLENGDTIIATVNGVIYTYKIFEMTVVDPSNTGAILGQNYDNSYITLVTCTPPGTTWKRLLVKAMLVDI